MDEMIPKREACKIICKHCKKFFQYCQHHWCCPLLTEIMKYEPQTCDTCKHRGDYDYCRDCGDYGLYEKE